MKTSKQKVTQHSDNHLVVILFLTLFLAACAAQPAVQEQEPEPFAYIAFDFDADQSAAPFRDYGAAYIVNVSGLPISLPLLTWDNSTMLSHFYYDERGLRPIFTEMMLSRVIRSDYLILQPGDRILAFSVAFFRENLEQYPEALYDMRIFVNDEQMDVRGIVR